MSGPDMSMYKCDNDLECGEYHLAPYNATETVECEDCGGTMYWQEPEFDWNKQAQKASEAAELRRTNPMMRFLGG